MMGLGAAPLLPARPPLGCCGLCPLPPVVASTSERCTRQTKTQRRVAPRLLLGHVGPGLAKSKAT